MQVAEPEIDLGDDEPEKPESKDPLDYQAAGLDEAFATLVKNRALIQQAKHKIEAAESDNKLALNKYKKEVGFSTLVGQYRATRSKGRHTTSLDPLLLMKNGVSTKIIQASTVEADGQPSWVVTDTLKVRAARAVA